MEYTILCKKILKENIDNATDIQQLEYKDHDIILKHTLFNEMYDKLYNDYGYSENDIISKISSISHDIQAYYDNKLCYFKIQINDILTDKNFNLKQVSDELQEKYSLIGYTLLEMMKEKEKIN